MFDTDTKVAIRVRVMSIKKTEGAREKGCVASHPRSHVGKQGERVRLEEARGTLD